MKSCLLTSLLALACVSTVSAENTAIGQRTNKYAADRLLEQYKDSLNKSYSRIYTGDVYAMDASEQSVGAANNMMPYYDFKLFAPFTYYKDVVKEQFHISLPEENEASANLSDKMYHAALLDVYLNNPSLVQNTAQALAASGPIVKPESESIKTNIAAAEEQVQVPTDPTAVPVDVVAVKPNFWTFAGDYYLQFLQNYVSGNWYKGGESNYSMVGAMTFQANYNNKQKVKWDNKLELKLGFITSKSDSLHSLKTSEDLIRLTSKLGLQASKNWYYTVQMVAYTQFLRGYKNNSRAVFSDFFSPFNVNLSVGMDYTVDWMNHKLKGSVHLAPLAYNFRYVDRLALATRYSLKEGRHTLHDLGSEFTVDLLWKFSENISWQTRLFGYTTYRRAELEWENTFTFKFNKYISSKVFLYPRFDDGAPRDGQHGYWQFREYFSLGFAYTF
ncbi:MAG: DUF3078 domain-containing protein [Prevotella sp.]|nr:DUF3078 domain-containing protein [Prevotella sp.]